MWHYYYYYHTIDYYSITAVHNKQDLARQDAIFSRHQLIVVYSSDTSPSHILTFSQKKSSIIQGTRKDWTRFTWIIVNRLDFSWSPLTLFHIPLSHADKMDGADLSRWRMTQKQKTADTSLSSTRDRFLLAGNPYVPINHVINPGKHENTLRLYSCLFFWRHFTTYHTRLSTRSLGARAYRALPYLLPQHNQQQKKRNINKLDAYYYKDHV